MRLDEVSRIIPLPTGHRPDVSAGTRRAETAPGLEPVAEAVLPSEGEADRRPEVDRQQLDSINDQLARVNRRLEYYLVDGTNEVAARIVDTESDEVVKYIPPKEVLELRSRLDEMVGLLFDKGA